MNLERFRLFATYKQRLKDIREEEKRTKALIDDLQEKLIDELLREGVRNVPIDVEGVGSVLLYPSVSTYARARDGDIDRLHIALQNAGLGDIIKTGVDGRTLAAVVREAEKPDGEPLPQELLDALSTGETHKLAMKKQA